MSSVKTASASSTEGPKTFTTVGEPFSPESHIEQVQIHNVNPNENEDAIHQARTDLANAVKTDSIMEQEKSGFQKQKEALGNKMNDIAVKAGLKETPTPPPKDNVVVDAAKIVSNDIREQIFKVAKPEEESK